MQTTPRAESSPEPSPDISDQNRPVSDVPWSVRLKMSLAEVYALNEQLCKTLPLDDAYWAESLASKNPEPFVM
jgi:hypothetical protein